MKLSVEDVTELKAKFRQLEYTWERFQGTDQAGQAMMLTSMLSTLVEEVESDFIQDRCVNIDTSNGQPICVIAALFTVMDGSAVIDDEDITSIEALLRAEGSVTYYALEKLHLHPGTVVMLQAAQSSADDGGTWKAAKGAAYGAYIGLDETFLKNL